MTNPTRPARATGPRRVILALALLALCGACAIALNIALASAAPAPAAVLPGPFAVGLRVVTLTDTSRLVHLPKGRTAPRTLVTYVRYPALGQPAAAGQPGSTDLLGAPPARTVGPFPLVVFAHGFAVTPGVYAQLLRSWASAGYVVAAPAFPLEKANAPGGPDESDLINEPGDMSFVISRLLAASGAATGPLAGLIDPTRIAVAGHSDGAEAALALAYSRRLRDSRVGAAMIFSGAEISGIGGYSFPRASPPLLSVQGTADTSNEPRYTEAYFGAARRPKYLLRLLGAGHLPPYTREQPQLAIVERVTIAFLDGYLKRVPGAVQRLTSFGRVKGTTALVAEP